MTDAPTTDELLDEQTIQGYPVYPELPWDVEQFEDKFVKVGDLTVRYWTMGESGPPVILVHGLGASVEFWVRNIPILARHYRVFAVDIVGFGRSDKPLQYDWGVERVADFMDDFLIAIGLDKVHWVANSMGGLIALVTAARHPGHTLSLTLVDSAGFSRRVTWLFRLMAIPLIGELLMMLGTWALRFTLRRLFADPKQVPEHWVQAWARILQQPGARRSFLRVLRSGIGPFGVKRRILQIAESVVGQIACPTLILWGLQDRILPFDGSLRALSQIPGAQLHVWDGAGHLPMLEKAASFNGVILNWLAETSRPH
ncbi:MAG: alpha/beta fold hydrolase [Anaerolineae bacterium]